jgi:putative oxidoreductase
MKFVPVVCRILLGLVFVVFGLNGLHQFMPGGLPPTGTPLGDWVAIMHSSRWMDVVAAFQVVGGLLVLFGGTVPLGLVILCPITVNILIFHLHLAGGHMMGPGLFVTVLELLLIYFYRANFAGILTTKARPVINAPVV